MINIILHPYSLKKYACLAVRGVERPFPTQSCHQTKQYFTTWPPTTGQVETSQDKTILSCMNLVAIHQWFVTKTI